MANSRKKPAARVPSVKQIADAVHLLRVDVQTISNRDPLLIESGKLREVARRLIEEKEILVRWLKRQRDDLTLANKRIEELERNAPPARVERELDGARNECDRLQREMHAAQIDHEIKAENLQVRLQRIEKLEADNAAIKAYATNLERQMAERAA